MRFILAATLYMRLRGLLGRAPSWLGEHGVLVLVPCTAIHTFGMTRAIDLAFADVRGHILYAERRLAPFKYRACAGAYFALERFSPPLLSAEGDEKWFEEGSDLLFVCSKSKNFYA